MAKGGKRGGVKAKPPPAPPHVPVVGELQPLDQSQKPVFSFEHLDRSQPGEWSHDLSSDEHAPEVLAFLCEMARLSWSEIGAMQTGGRRRHKKHHSQEVSSLRPEAQRYAEQRGFDRIFGEDAFRFRLGGEKRLWGFRVGRTFHVVWWDPLHKVYPQDT